MLLQTEQRRRVALTSRRAAARAAASSSLERRMWKARRWALFAPTPGSFFSSSIRRDMGSANLDMGKFNNWAICNWEIKNPAESIVYARVRHPPKSTKLHNHSIGVG